MLMILLLFHMNLIDCKPCNCGVAQVRDRINCCVSHSRGIPYRLKNSKATGLRTARLQFENSKVTMDIYAKV